MISELTRQKIELPNGVNLAYVRGGQATGAPLVFVHGTMNDLRMWQPQWQAFTGQYDCIAYSRRYAYPNDNRPIASDYSALTDAEDLGLFLDALGVKQASLIGLSYGGFASLAFALKHPRRVASMVLVEPPMMRYADDAPDLRPTVAAFEKNHAHAAEAAFRAGDDDLGMRLLLSGIIGREAAKISPKLVAMLMPNVEEVRAISLSDDEFPLLDKAQVAALDIPTLLVSGAKSAPVHQALIACLIKAMPQAQTAIIQGAGHSVPQEQPEAFNAAVAEFLDNLA